MSGTRCTLARPAPKRPEIATRKPITTALTATAAALIVAMPISAQAAHAPSKANIRAAIKALFKKH